MGVHGAELTDADSGEVHVYAHPSKPVANLKQQKENDKVQGLMFKANKGGKFLKKLWCCVGGNITR